MDNGEKYTAGWLKSHYTAHFEVLYKETYKRLYLFASNFLRDEETAGDLVQDVFTGLWEKGKNMRDDIALVPYLQTAIRNLCVDYHRKLQIEDRYQSTRKRRRRCPTLWRRRKTGGWRGCGS